MSQGRVVINVTRDAVIVCIPICRSRIQGTALKCFEPKPNGVYESPKALCMNESRSMAMFHAVFVKLSFAYCCQSI